MDKASERFYFIICTEENEDIGFFLTVDTVIIPSADGVGAEELRSGQLEDAIVYVEYGPSDKSLINEEAKKIKAYNADFINIRAYKTSDSVTLSDGTEAELWRYHNTATAYFLQDGTQLLRVQDTIGPQNVYTGGTESFHDLSVEAQTRVHDFFTAQGHLYDELAELEKAYAAYCGGAFDTRILSQEIVPVSSCDRLMYFITTAMVPTDNRNQTSYRRGAAFDKNTGEHIDNIDLFSCPQDEILIRLLDIAEVSDPVLRAEMEQAFDPECIVFFPENIEISFPEGSLPSQTYSYMLGLEYDQRLMNILHPWAVPSERIVQDLIG